MNLFGKIVAYSLGTFLICFPEQSNSSQPKFEEREPTTNASQRINSQDSGLNPELPLEIITQIITYVPEFSNLQTFEQCRHVSKAWKKITERVKIPESFKIPERHDAIPWIVSFRDPETHVFNLEAFFSDFKARNKHTEDSYKRLSEAADLYPAKNNLFCLKRQWYGHVSTTPAGFSLAATALLKDINLLEKDPQAQSSTALQEKRHQLREMLLLWQPYAIAHDLAVRLFAQNGSSIWDNIQEIAQKPSALQFYLLNPYVAGLYGDDFAQEQLPKLQKMLLNARDRIVNQELIKAYKLQDFKRIEYMVAVYRAFELETKRLSLHAEAPQIQKIQEELISMHDEFVLADVKLRKLLSKEERTPEEQSELTHLFERGKHLMSLRNKLVSWEHLATEIKLTADSIQKSIYMAPGIQADYHYHTQASFKSLPPYTPQDALALFNTLESLLINVQNRLALSPVDTGQHRINYFNKLLRYASKHLNKCVNDLESHIERTGTYPFAAFYRVLTRINKIKEDLPHTYAKAAQEAHALADLTQQEKEASTLYEQEAYFLKQQAFYSAPSSKAEVFLKSAQSYAKAGQILSETDAQKAEALAQHASQMTLESLKSLEKPDVIDVPEIYTVFKEAASLVIPSDKAKAAELCEKAADYLRGGTEYIDYIKTALSYIIAGELIKEASPTKANILFQKAANEELALMKSIKDESSDEIYIDQEAVEEISDTYKEAALCLESYNEEKAATLHAKAEELKKYAEDSGEESSQSSASNGG